MEARIVDAEKDAGKSTAGDMAAFVRRDGCERLANFRDSESFFLNTWRDEHVSLFLPVSKFNDARRYELNEVLQVV